MSRWLLCGPRASVAAVTAFVFVVGSLPTRRARAGDEERPRAPAEGAAASTESTESTEAPVATAARAAPQDAPRAALDTGSGGPTTTHGAVESASSARPSARGASGNAGAAAVTTPGAPTPNPDSLAVGGDKTGVSSQAISVPQGAGKIQGMGESFSTQLSTGVANFSVPFALVPARGHAQPSLSLSYSSASGHGVAGVGWDVGVPFIARQTDRGLPRYSDPPQGAAWQPTQDRFVFNGGHELVPICLPQGGSCNDGTGSSAVLPNEVMPVWSDGWQYFRPRVEGSFLRFFWSPDHRTWRVQSKSGETMELGAPLDTSGDTSALESDPLNPQHIFRWDLARQYDAQGNANPQSGLPSPVNVIVYRYLQDGAMAYLSDVYDTSPVANPTAAPLSAYAHHVHLAYERRPDATFSFRRGWQTSQSLRLTGVDVTSFNDNTGARELVRRYHLAYDPAFHMSLLASVQTEGRCGSTGTAAASTAENSSGLLPATSCPALPPMTFGYQHVTPFRIDGSAASADLPGYEGFDERPIAMSSSPPNSIDENLTDLFDINSDGLPDVVVTFPGQDSTFPFFINSSQRGIADSFSTSKLGVVGVLGATSTDINLVNDNVAALDVDGDGTIDWVHQPAPKSYAIYSPQFLGGGWSMVGRVVPTSAFQDPRLDLGEDTPDINVLDANGDGLVDVVRATGTEMQTFFALGRYPNGDGNFGSATWTGARSADLSLTFVPSCVPLVAPGVPVRFSDSTIRLADMNGDGLTDIVYVQQGDIRYWPGRGDGSWGTGSLGSCPSGFAPDTFIAMQGAPQYSDPNGSGLRLDDVNGDGLDDLVQVRFDAVDIWLNVDGGGWTPDRHTIQGVRPAQGPLWQSKVRLVDINGSGTRDILWGEGGNYRYMDLSGGQRPWVLTHVANGLGKTTDLEYSTSTALMLADARAGQPWTNVAPMPIHVVTKSTERDHMDAVGRAPGVYVTEYSYRDAFYEGRQREFRGFRTARSRRDGDANSPSSTTVSTFLLGECENDENVAPDPCSEEGRWQDNPREALKGLPLVSETVDDASEYLSTTHHTYRLRKLYSGLDGREVRYAFESQSDAYSYDTAPFTPAAGTVTLTDVELETTPGTVTTDTTASITLRSASGRAHMHKSSIVDLFGNATDTIDDGCVDGCLNASGSPGPDDSITSHTTAARRPDDPSGWMYRPVESFVAGAVAPDTRVHTLKDMLMTYDLGGNLTQTSAVIAGSLPLDRFNPSAGGTAQSPPGASVDSTSAAATVMSTTSYTVPFGSPQHQAAPNARCRDITYDPLYEELPNTEIVSVGQWPGYPAPPQANMCGATPLTAVAFYDRGLHAVTKVQDLHGEITTATYDGLGRIVALTKPDPANPTADPPTNPPTVQIQYLLTSDPAGQPFSRVHTLMQDGANPTVQSYRESWGYVDGLGRVVATLDQADLSAGDGGSWVVDGLTTYDAKGAAQRAFLAFFYGASDGGSFPLGTQPPTPYGSQRYDAFGRQLQTFGLDGTITLQSAYHAVSVDKFDAADLLPGPHQGTPASARTDGHGRTIAVTERIHTGNAIESHETRTTYLPTGALQSVTRVRVNAADAPVVRWIRYDSLGRMVLNVEPNATAGFAGTPSTELDPPPATGSGAMHAWRYAYDDNGDLVGTSDARGCGANYHYDAGGRVVAEDFSPCLGTQPNYSRPDLLTGDATEAFYRYDTVDPTVDAEVLTIAGFPLSSITTGFLLGRLFAIKDRGAETVTNYDGRGRAIGVARRIASPVTPPASNDTLASRYVSHWYVRTVGFDGADRPVAATTGADNDNASVQQLLDANGQSVVTTTYSKRGTVSSVASGYGPLVTKIVRDADGLVGSIVYGDTAHTTSAMSYDNRRRLSSVTTYRGPPALWSSPPTTYQPAPTPNGPPSTFQLLLEDVDYLYDDVDNPVEIRDFRNPAEWPPGAKPVSRKVEYDDLYRVTQVDYESPGGVDTWVSPFDAEDQGIDSDPRRGTPSPHVKFPTRVLQQSFAYDWLGNTTQTDDDVHGFYDRSLGAITNGAAAQKPYQLQSASAGGTNGGSLGATYDDAGNLTALSVSRAGTCVPAGPNCSQSFTYDWDEVGRLVHARRFDGGATTTAAELVYAYDATDNRTLKTAIDPQSTFPLHTVYVFDSLEVRRAVFAAVEEGGVVVDDFVRNSTTEVPYLFAHGVRLARVHFSASGVEVSSNALHVMLELPDHLGSSSIVVDQATSEVVERETYTAYGGKDSDYRPQRWNSFREDYGFTGKEEDIEVGLQYFGKRYLSPALGRWVSADPSTVHACGADLNAYAYVHGSLLKATDPLGLADAPDAGAPDASVTDAAAPSAPAQMATTDASANASDAGRGQTDISGTAASPENALAQPAVTIGPDPKQQPNVVAPPERARPPHPAVALMQVNLGRSGSGMAAGVFPNTPAGLFGNFTAENRAVIGLAAPGVASLAEGLALTTSPISSGEDRLRGTVHLAVGTLEIGMLAAGAAPEVAVEPALAGSLARTGDALVLSRGVTEYLGGPRITLEEAEAAAARNGIDMRMFKLEYEEGNTFDYGGVHQSMDMETGDLYGIKRAVDGRIRLTLFDKGLRSEGDAVETIAHELNHVRGYLKTGSMSSEASAEGAAEALSGHMR
jgi:RHS repeat-associated protein